MSGIRQNTSSVFDTTASFLARFSFALPERATGMASKILPNGLPNVIPALRPVKIDMLCCVSGVPGDGWRRCCPDRLLLDLPALRGILHGWAPMKPNTALCFILNGLVLGLSLVPAAQPHQHVRRTRASP